MVFDLVKDLLSTHPEVSMVVIILIMKATAYATPVGRLSRMGALQAG